MARDRARPLAPSPSGLELELEELSSGPLRAVLGLLVGRLFLQLPRLQADPL